VTAWFAGWTTKPSNPPAIAEQEYTRVVPRSLT
jgi:hypothetical protein